MHHDGWVYLQCNENTRALHWSEKACDLKGQRGDTPHFYLSLENLLEDTADGLLALEGEGTTNLSGTDRSSSLQLYTSANMLSTDDVIAFEDFNC